MADDEQPTTPVDERDSVDHEEFTSDDKQCPECGAPVDNLRKSCANCGREYQDDDYDDREAGNELRAGVALDDEGNEVVEEGEVRQDDEAGSS